VAVEVVMPAMEMAQDTARLVRWLKTPGEPVRKGEPLLEIETDKVTVEIEAPASGVLANVTVQAGDEVPVGRVIALLLAESERPAAPLFPESKPAAGSPAAPLVSSPSRGEVARRRTPASPKARRLAQEQGLDLALLSGSGPEGAVLAADVRAGGVRQPAPLPGGSDAYRAIPIKGMRKVIAERVRSSHQTVPHIALTLSADMGAALRVRERLATTGTLSLTALLVKLVGVALPRHPRLNAHLVGDEIREFTAVHLGVAVALSDGLVVPVVHNVERKAVSAIQAELRDLTDRARAGSLKLKEVQGATFTLSNLGMFGVEQFTALVNPPEVGILAVGSTREVPVGVNGQIVLRPRMQMTLSADHRTVDGAVAAAFLNTLKGILENPLPDLD
jgi:pyruvate dehydrogenase E2 component (dihydrolipoamide acetyltransferase)